MDYIKYNLIEGYEDYIIFTTGKIYSKYTNKFMKPQLTEWNYYKIRLSNNNNKKIFKLHRLLALAFIPNLHKLPTVDHIDKNPFNNNLNNLRWASYSKQCINRNKLRNNKTGYNGVHFDKNRYRAKLIIDKKPHTKSFSILKYGKEEALRLAIEFRKSMEDKHYKNLL